jgi:transglutaminase-like putative cysteine protease
MNQLVEAPLPALELAVRLGCKLQYFTGSETPTLLNVKPRQDAFQHIAQEALKVSPIQPTCEFEDDHGNAVLRMNLPPGVTTISYDAIVHVPSVSEDFAHVDRPIAPNRLPADLLRYTLPSRYCDSDKLRDFAWQKFGQYQQGLERIQAICDWIHTNIEYRTGSGSAEITAHDVIKRGYGVCRDFAHCGVALCRAQLADAIRERLRAGYRLFRSRHTHGFPCVF